VPSSVASSFLWLGLIFAVLGAATAAVIVGVFGVLWELYLFYRSGVE
jgi:hypothetical protein